MAISAACWEEGSIVFGDDDDGGEAYAGGAETDASATLPSVVAQLLLTLVSAPEVRGWYGSVDMMEILLIVLSFKFSCIGINVFRY